jgi:hypothetical protein
MIHDDIHKYLIPNGASSRIPLLAQASIEELSAEKPDHQLIKSYLFALYMEIIRFQDKYAVNYNVENTPPPGKIHQYPALAHSVLRRRWTLSKITT